MNVNNLINIVVSHVVNTAFIIIVIISLSVNDVSYV